MFTNTHMLLKIAPLVFGCQIEITGPKGELVSDTYFDLILEVSNLNYSGTFSFQQ